MATWRSYWFNVLFRMFIFKMFIAIILRLEKRELLFLTYGKITKTGIKRNVTHQRHFVDFNNEILQVKNVYIRRSVTHNLIICTNDERNKMITYFICSNLIKTPYANKLKGYQLEEPKISCSNCSLHTSCKRISLCILWTIISIIVIAKKNSFNF